MRTDLVAPAALGPAVQRALADALIRQDLASFIRRSFEVVAPGEELRFNWHIQAMAHVLRKVMEGKTKRLIVTVPPRHLKSISVSVAFPAFLLGHDPTRKIICASYSHDLAVKHHLDCRAVMRSSFYQRIFPGTRISVEKNTESEILTTQRGGRYATSVGGTLTGRGGNLLIIDDPTKPEEAMSEASRHRAQQWFETTAVTRLNIKSEDAIIVVMQRLHVEDLAGTLLEQGGWERLDLQAIADDPIDIPIGPNRVVHRCAGHLLHAQRESALDLENIKAAMGTMAFSAQYQQRPVPLEGNVIKRGWLRFYDAIPAVEQGDRIVISWDTASKASEISDYSVGTVWLVKKEYGYLLDVIRGRFEFPALRRMVLASRARWPESAVLIEDKGSGTSLIQHLRSEQISVIAIQPDGDKTTRLYTCTPMFEAGAVLFPREAPWLSDLLGELLGFPGARHDDQVDSISQALSWMARQRARNNQVGELRAILIPHERKGVVIGQFDYS